MTAGGGLVAVDIGSTWTKGARFLVRNGRLVSAGRAAVIDIVRASYIFAIPL